MLYEMECLHCKWSQEACWIPFVKFVLCPLRSCIFSKNGLSISVYAQSSSFANDCTHNRPSLENTEPYGHLQAPYRLDSKPHDLDT